MLKTTVGLFDSRVEAENAKKELIEAGIAASAIDLVGGDTRGSNVENADVVRDEHKGFLTKLKEFFGASPEYENDINYYQEGLSRGSFVVSVTTEDDIADDVADILEDCGAQDVEEKAQQWRATGWAGPSQPTDIREGRESERAMPIIEEELHVGKRQRPTGSVRIYNRVVENPVEEAVNLTDEKVIVDRQRVNRPATAADLKNFQEGTVEFTETTEEPVVSKQAHVTEEVKVAKERRSREQKVRDTVRKTEVEVEGSNQPAAERSGADLDDPFRKDFESKYAARGHLYEHYAPAYRFGSQCASHERYRDSDWDAVESDVRKSWEKERGQGTWTTFKDAIRHGWNTVRGKRAA